jgi:transposase
MSGLSRFSADEGRAITRLHLAGEKCSAIARKINSQRHVSHHCTSGGVRKYIARGKAPQIPKQRRTKRLDTQALAFMDGLIDKDREISALDLQRQLQSQLNITVSESVISKERRKLGWTFASTKYAQMVRVVNKEKRLLFCNDILSRGDTFDNVVFTDECTVRCQRFLSKQFRRKGEPMSSLLRPVPKHPFSVSIWCDNSNYCLYL